jgi:SAM-dependent methyltransferase
VSPDWPPDSGPRPRVAFRAPIDALGLALAGRRRFGVTRDGFRAVRFAVGPLPRAGALRLRAIGLRAVGLRDAGLRRAGLRDTGLRDTGLRRAGLRRMAFAVFFLREADLRVAAVFLRRPGAFRAMTELYTSTVEDTAPPRLSRDRLQTGEHRLMPSDGGSNGLVATSRSAFSRVGLSSLLELYESLHAARSAAPEGELAAFDGLVVASQYRLPYGLTLSRAARGSRVLDWGCGDGHFSRFLLDAGYTVTAYSLQHEPFVLRNLPEALRRRYSYVQGDRRIPTALPFEDSSFDAALSIGVLEHVREVGGTELGSLGELRRVLRPEGFFLCCHLPNKYSLSEAAASFFGGLRKEESPRHHQFRFTSADISALCGRAGLELLELGTYGLLPRNVLRLLPAQVKDSPGVARLVNGLDDVLAGLAPVFCQNRYFVARRAGAQ